MLLTQTAALIRDTFREAFARKLFWGLFGLSTLLILFFLFILKVDIVEGALATVSMFGQPAHRRVDIQRLMREFYGGIATFLYTWQMALAVFASAGLIPSVLEPGRIELIVSKPIARPHILFGRFLGNIAVVGLNIIYLVLAIWIIFGIKTQIWGKEFLWVIATTLFIFSVLLSVVVLVGVLSGSSALATMVTIALMIISPIIAQVSTANRVLSSETSREIWRVIYHVLPKIYDIGRITRDFVRAEPINDFTAFWTTAIFGAAMLVTAIYAFNKRNF